MKLPSIRPILAMLSVLTISDTSFAQDVTEISYICGDYEEVPGVLTFASWFQASNVIGEQPLAHHETICLTDNLLACASGYRVKELDIRISTSAEIQAGSAGCYVKACCEEIAPIESSTVAIPDTILFGGYNTSMNGMYFPPTGITIPK